MQVIVALRGFWNGALRQHFDAAALPALRGNQEQTDRSVGPFAQTVSIPAFFGPEKIQSIMDPRQPLS